MVLFLRGFWRCEVRAVLREVEQPDGIRDYTTVIFAVLF